MIDKNNKKINEHSKSKEKRLKTEEEELFLDDSSSNIKMPTLPNPQSTKIKNNTEVEYNYHQVLHKTSAENSSNSPPKIIIKKEKIKNINDILNKYNKNVQIVAPSNHLSSKSSNKSNMKINNFLYMQKQKQENKVKDHLQKLKKLKSERKANEVNKFDTDYKNKLMKDRIELLDSIKQNFNKVIYSSLLF